MTTQPDKLIFTQSPKIELGSNFFINVPVILQYKETPLISIEHSIDAGFTTNIPIYHSDGTYLAKVKGSQLYSTEEGKKSRSTTSARRQSNSLFNKRKRSF
ncbi:hypothetical protein LRS40_01365 (plasmid) [Leclercia sp. G3L]|uniref:hypothetical protein n=1 Tax=Leclercia sp. G3L TaxID=2898725 RepID=UPI001E32CDF7|nr:hypothetical protein [Leclercia sp. G3L]UGB00635.1 hypothetical protein LRS40_01365 [Leclercia sp. G3L]